METQAKQNVRLEKLRSTAHEGFCVVYYYTYIIILLIHVFQTQNPICNVIPAIIVNLPNVTLVRKGDEYCIARKLICCMHLYYTLKFEGRKLRSLMLCYLSSIKQDFLIIIAIS